MGLCISTQTIPVNTEGKSILEFNFSNNEINNIIAENYNNKNYYPCYKKTYKFDKPINLRIKK